jgi:hypothetical protein
VQTLFKGIVSAFQVMVYCLRSFSAMAMIDLAEAVSREMQNSR